MKMLALTLVAVCAFAPSWAESAADRYVATRTQAHPVAVPYRATELVAGQPVDVLISLNLRNEASLDQIVAAVQAGGGQTISPEQVLADYAPTEAQVQQVVQFLRDNHFRYITVSPNRLLISASGTHASVVTAFNTRLASYTATDGRQVRYNVSDVRVPQNLGGVIQAVHGLQTADRFRSMMTFASASAAQVSPMVGVTPKAVTTYHYPKEFPAIYGASGLATAAKVEVGIIAAGNITQTLTDLTAFAKSNGYAVPTVNKVLTGAASSDTSGVPEWNLDSQSILGAAGGQVKRMSFYVASTMSNPDIIKAVNAAVTANTAQVVNVSLGECEMAAKASGMVAALDATFKIAVAQGQVFSVSTGDSGSDECGNGTTQQSYPATSPYVIAVGGTTLSTTSGAYTGETVWAGTGGGASAVEAAPAWQVSAGVLGKSTARGVPDVAFDADPASGAAIMIAGNLYSIGGTSLSAPLFSGFWARILASQTKKIAFPAASLYKYLSNRTLGLSRDVTSGSNGAYKAATGWDYTTGFGSLNVGTLNTFISKNTF